MADDETTTTETASPEVGASIPDGNPKHSVPVPGGVYEPVAGFEDGEFPTAWHREAHIADLKREVEGATIRGAEDQVKNAERELARLVQGAKDVVERPKRAAQETRKPAAKPAADEKAAKPAAVKSAVKAKG